MRYRLTCLTPLLAGDGHKLSPIDYMVWKDQINVLDQTRIFRLLAKGPRLEGYLVQLRKAEKLDFGSWGGFAQNYAERRVPFEFGGAAAIWERARVESLQIPTFASGPSGPFVPGSVIKGALRTGLVFENAQEQVLRDVAAKADAADRPLRRPADAVEGNAVGNGGNSRTRPFLVSDSATISYTSMKIYLLRVATLQQKGARMEVGWKQGGATVDGSRVADSTPWFAEMAAPGASFEGTWTENDFFSRTEIVRAMRWNKPPTRTSLFAAANSYAERLLDLHAGFVETTGLAKLGETIARLKARVAEARQSDTACVLPIGWGAGFLSKTAFPDPHAETPRRILRLVPLYSKAIRTGMPFPKTRRVIFEGNQPSSLPGWTLLEVI